MGPHEILVKDLVYQLSIMNMDEMYDTLSRISSEVCEDLYGALYEDSESALGEATACEH